MPKSTQGQRTGLSAQGFNGASSAAGQSCLEANTAITGYRLPWNDGRWATLPR